MARSAEDCGTPTMNSPNFCSVSELDGILTITLQRPEVLNALHEAAHIELNSIFGDFAADPQLRIAILTGSGERAFCVGTDLKSLAATGPYTYPPGGFGGITTRFDLDKPVIAAVNGLCLGGGLEILAACDLAIADAHAQFALPEPRVGLAALGGGALHRLARQLPMKQAMWLALTGLRISADQAQAMGLVNQVVPQGGCVEAAQALAHSMLDCAPLAVECTKQVMLRSTAYPELADAMAATYPAAQRMLASEDAREGPRAFAEKRKPVWKGR
jgi:crotonobetainyl-CoA hydratase